MYGMRYDLMHFIWIYIDGNLFIWIYIDGNLFIWIYMDGMRYDLMVKLKTLQF